MAITTSHIVRVVIRGVHDSQAVYNCLDYMPKSLNPGFGSSIQQCVNAVWAMWQSSFLPIQSSELGVAEVVGTVIEGTRVHPEDANKPIEDRRMQLILGDTASLVPTTGNFGSILGAALPTYAAATIRKKTAKAGRSKRGGLRIGGLVEADTGATTPNVLTAGSLAALQTAAAELVPPIGTAVAGDTLELCILAQTDMLRDKVPVTVPSNWAEPVVSCSVNSYLGSQVSRKRKSIATGFALAEQAGKEH